MKSHIIKEPIPALAGVYLFKDGLGRVIYTGKAKNLKKRVQSYFSQYKVNWKIQALIQESDSVEYILTKNETEALLLEAQLIRDNKPKFNVFLKDGQPFIYILFTKFSSGFLPKIQLVRNKKKKGRYFGPFLHKRHARSVFQYLVETFRLSLCNKKMENGCLDLHIGLCAGNCKKDFDKEGYFFRLNLAYKALKNNHHSLIKSINKKIEFYNEKFDFEKAMHLYQYLENIDTILSTLRTKFNESKYKDLIFNTVVPTEPYKISEKELSIELQKFLEFEKPIKKIDCFDISHFQGNHIVGSCIRFTDGRPEKSSFRKFKIKSLKKQNDYAALQEIVYRRYKTYLDNNLDKECDLPDLILIDGGKGQLSAVRKIIHGIPCISLAKREETIFSSNSTDPIVLDVKETVGKLLISLRDYAHHFAINYHRFCRSSKLKQ